MIIAVSYAMFLIHRPCCEMQHGEIKHSGAEKGYLAKGKTVQLLCSPCCTDILQLPYVAIKDL